jgi:8-oxo-dGTP pyrophosphatase MutT (NUDIX family)
VRQALALPGFNHVRAWLRMAPNPRPLYRTPGRPGAARPAGVLLLLYPLDGALTLVLTRRTEHVATHKGQISLPGGAQDAGDASPQQAALREVCEELDICLDDIQMIGSLTPLYVLVSDFEIYPYVGFTARRPDFNPQPEEVAEVLELPLRSLLDDTLKRTERWNVRGLEMDVPFYRVAGHAVWGATAIILSELEGRLRAVLGLD